MAIQIVPFDQQGFGEFNNGKIVENKPIGFPKDGSLLKPYSNLFYWAHARALKESTIALHPHKGFEICTFVLKGDIKHFDTQLNEWKNLQAGDAQIIRAGSGISHSEWMGQHAELFQIWFDPNLAKTLSQPASYNDYSAQQFPSKSLQAGTLQTIIGEGSPFKMDTPGIEFFQLTLDAGGIDLPINPSAVTSIYVLEGDAIVNGEVVRTSDFAVVTEIQQLEITVFAPTKLFLLQSPLVPGYTTYARQTLRPQ